MQLESEYDSHIRHPHAFLAKYSWCGEHLEDWDDSAGDEISATIRCFAKSMYQPCRACVERLKQALDHELGLEEFIASLGDRWVRPKVLNIVPLEDWLAAPIRKYIIDRQAAGKGDEDKYLDNVFLCATEETPYLKTRLRDYLHIHFWDVRLPGWLTECSADPPKQPSVHLLPASYIKSIIPGWGE